MKKLIRIFAIFLFVSQISMAQKKSKAKLTGDTAKIEQLISQMTLEEKAGQMTQVTLAMIAKDSWGNKDGSLDMNLVNEYVHKYKVGSFLNTVTFALTKDQWHKVITNLQDEALKERLKIPIIYGLDAIHGQTYTQESTLFPHNIAMAATRNIELAKQVTKVTAKELRASGTRWNFAPVLDCGRNPLWSRQAETYGEDPYICTQMGVAVIKAYEEEGLKNPTAVASCMKHYLGYSNPRSGKDRSPTMMPEIEVREYYLNQFREAVKAGASTIMVNSGDLNGTPVHASKYWLTDVLRKELGFKGLIVTDWEDIKRLHYRHKVADSERAAVVMAINAGIDMSMVPTDFSFPVLLKEAVEKGEVSMERVNDAVRRVLELKFKVGLFDNPYPEAGLDKNFNQPEFQTLALESARESMTLLKNKNQVLPLTKNTKVLLAGPGANSITTLNGPWSYIWQGNVDTWHPKRDKTIAQAIEDKIGKSNLINLGVKTYNASENFDVNKLKLNASKADVIVICLGEDAYAETAGNIDDLTLDKNQLELAQAAILTGKPVVLVLTEGRPRIIASIEPGISSILQGYWSGSNAAKAIADVLFGDYNPSGKLPYTYPRYPNSIFTYDAKITEQLVENGGDIVVDGESTAPQYYFGTGLSYTTFEYSNLKLSTNKLKGEEKLEITLTIKNTGKIAGKHTVELYTRDHYASIVPSQRRLRAFTKVDLKAGESQNITFTISKTDLAFINEALKNVTEAGDFDIMIGNLKGTFNYE